MSKSQQINPKSQKAEIAGKNSPFHSIFNSTIFVGIAFGSPGSVCQCRWYFLAPFEVDPSDINSSIYTQKASYTDHPLWITQETELSLARELILKHRSQTKNLLA